MIEQHTSASLGDTSETEHFAAVAARSFPRLTETPMPQLPSGTLPASHPPNSRVRQVAEWWATGVIADPAAAMTHICGILGVLVDKDDRIAGRAGAR